MDRKLQTALAITTYVICLYEKSLTFRRKPSVCDRKIEAKKFTKIFKFGGAWD